MKEPYFPNHELTELEKETKFKAFKLVQAIFEEIAKVSDFKGFENDGGEHFRTIEKASKKIAVQFVDEIINEVENKEYWLEVRENLK